MVNVIKEHKEGVRSKILKAAMRLFVKHGIRAVKMDDVAAELQMSKRTLYEIYNNKEDLLVEGVLKSFEQGDLEIQKFANDGHNVLEVIVEACRQKISFYNSANPLFFEDAAKYEKLHQAIEETKKKNNQSFLEFMQHGVTEGYFREDINFELVSKLLEYFGRYMIENKMYRDYPIKEIFKNSIYVSIRGLCTLKGVETLDNLIEQVL